MKWWTSHWSPYHEIGGLHVGPLEMRLDPHAGSFAMRLVNGVLIAMTVRCVSQSEMFLS